MIDALRQRWARRAVARAVRDRRPRPLDGPPRSRTVALFLPPDEPGQRAAWSFLRRLDLPPGQVVPVLVGETVFEVPDAFAGRIVRIGADRLDWRRLPTPAVCAEVWSAHPDVVVSLLASLDPAAALLVGGSPAAVRIGRFEDGADAICDLMVASEGDAEAAADALSDLLARMTPVILPLREPGPGPHHRTPASRS